MSAFIIFTEMNLSKHWQGYEARSQGEFILTQNIRRTNTLPRTYVQGLPGGGGQADGGDPQLGGHGCDYG